MAIQTYIEMKKAQGIEETTINRYKIILDALDKWKKIDSIGKDDLIKYFNSKGFKDKAESNQNLNKIVISAYFKEEKKQDVVSWIKLKKLKDTLSPEQTLTPDDINKLLEVADNPYDKALIAFLYDAGCRISEAQRIKWKDLQDTTDGIIVSVPTKKTSAGYRKMILPFASQYLKNLRIYAYGEPDDFIFPFIYRTHCMRINKIKQKSKIDKPFTCHKLRHAQATQLVSDGVQEAIIRKKLGWSPNSTMISKYQHIGDNAVIDATLETQGKVRKHNVPVEIVQPEKLSLQDAAGHMFKLEEENSDLKTRLDRLESLIASAGQTRGALTTDSITFDKEGVTMKGTINKDMSETERIKLQKELEDILVKNGLKVK